eukprot:scaffold29354_cov62-Cyclotella_meneghiniana.AAC.3
MSSRTPVPQNLTRRPHHPVTNASPSPRPSTTTNYASTESPPPVIIRSLHCQFYPIFHRYYER